MGYFTYLIKTTTPRAKYQESHGTHFGADTSDAPDSTLIRNDGKISAVEVRDAAYRMERDFNSCRTGLSIFDYEPKVCVQPEMLAGEEVPGSNGHRKKVTPNLYETSQQDVGGPFTETKTIKHSEEVIVTWGERGPTEAEKVVVSWPRGGDPLPPIPQAKQVKPVTPPSWGQVKASYDKTFASALRSATSAIKSAELFTANLHSDVTSSVSKLVEQHIPSPIRTWAEGIATSLFGESPIREVDLLDTHHDPLV